MKKGIDITKKGDIIALSEIKNHANKKSRALWKSSPAHHLKERAL